MKTDAGALAFLAIGMLTPLATAAAQHLVGEAWQVPLTVAGLVLLWGCAVGVVLRLRPGIRFFAAPLMTRGDLGIAVLAGIIGALCVPLLALGVAILLGETGTIEVAATPLVLLIAGVVTAAVTEEVLFRAVPLGLLLGLLYLWRRNLLVVIIAHLLIDAPLIVLAVLS